MLVYWLYNTQNQGDYTPIGQLMGSSIPSAPLMEHHIINVCMTVYIVL